MNAGDSDFADAGFRGAVDAIQTRIARERADPACDPRCLSLLLQHGRRTDRALVLFHGFTNCPRQFALLAELFYSRGFNVYVPLLPRHGLLDKLTTALEALTVEELTDAAATALSLTSGLGSGANALGLSVGATMVAWLAQTHAFDRAVLFRGACLGDI